MQFLKQLVFAAVLLLIGAFAGVFYTLGHYRDYNAAKLGAFLDRDLVYLSNGQTQWGNIVSKHDDKILFALDEESVVELRPSEIKRVEENYYTRYLKDML